MQPLAPHRDVSQRPEQSEEQPVGQFRLDGPEAFAERTFAAKSRSSIALSSKRAWRPISRARSR